MKKISFVISFCIVTLIFFPAIAKADSWGSPQKQIFYSNDKRFIFEIIPGKESAGSRVPSRGTLFRKENNDKSNIIWSRQLENNESAVSAIVSATGKYVVTFDDWGHMGYGDKVVVVYGQDGKLLYKFGLEDILSNTELQQIPISVSSRHWSKGEHLIDEREDILILKTIAEKRIDLKTGKLIDK